MMNTLTAIVPLMGHVYLQHHTPTGASHIFYCQKSTTWLLQVDKTMVTSAVVYTMYFVGMLLKLTGSLCYHFPIKHWPSIESFIE